MEDKLQGTENQEEYKADKEADAKLSIIREMSLESAGSRLVPDRSQRQWMIAQAHIVDRNGKLEEAAKFAEIQGKKYVKPAVEFLGA